MDNLVPGGASLDSRTLKYRPLDGETLICEGVHETVIASDGSEYPCTSWVMGQYGPLLGYNYWGGVEANPCGSFRSPLESRVARLLIEVLPWANTQDHMARFALSGGDATEMAVKLAIAYTNRENVYSYGYHGSSFLWADSKYGTQAQFNKNNNILKLDKHSLQWLRNTKMAGSVAAIIVEDDGKMPYKEYKEFLTQCREVCDKLGALLIFDEVVTGFRYGIGGATEHYGVIPDLACYGKALGGDEPISAVVGNKDVMLMLSPFHGKHVHFSRTYFGHPRGLRAAQLNLKYYRDHPELYDHIYSVGDTLMSTFNGLANENYISYRIVGNNPTRTWFDVPDSVMKKFSMELLRRGHLVWRPNFATLIHTKEDAISLAKEAVEVLNEMRNS
jgi:glutamate-1-semialdehyde aminotransferase